MAVRVVMDPIGMARLREKAGDFAHTVAKHILLDIIDDIPIDTGEMLRSLRLERVRTFAGFVSSAPGLRHSTKIWVGTDHWHLTEYGAEPHIITTAKRTLKNPKTGQRFGPVVHHPGTPTVAYMRRNLFKKRLIVRWL